MVFNHHPNSSYESANSDMLGFYSSGGGGQHDYQEIEDRNRSYDDQEQLKVPPLPPKPKIHPIKPSNWQQTNKENFFKMPQEIPRRAAPLAIAERLDGPPSKSKNDVYLDQPTSSFV